MVNSCQITAEDALLFAMVWWDVDASRARPRLSVIGGWLSDVKNSIFWMGMKIFCQWFLWRMKICMSFTRIKSLTWFARRIAIHSLINAISDYNHLIDAVIEIWMKYWELVDLYCTAHRIKATPRVHSIFSRISLQKFILEGDIEITGAMRSLEIIYEQVASNVEKYLEVVVA